ncbi:hypothetical protein GGS23DRAFT_599766 [Durotheca rogersii]|uniref:uncharacterized protein n=1 Tax=Durotheca rogersii TaxID=419775 RepID=UPI00221F4FCA|nr:uncharacterized protein GGS23DRAFT_599766 [Durotheca rogersii]KAI5860116.1 hypothetical protein GGS23DRAFT_599766 [Durotheca rogersii]
MAQGTIKPKKPSSSSSSSSAAGAGRKTKPPAPKKKGARVAKPKRAAKADQLQQRYAAGLAAKTERLLGERAGHLELIGKGGAKGAPGAKAGGGKKEKGKEGKGGSRKFG